MGAEKKKQMGVLGLIVALVVGLMIVFTILFFLTRRIRLSLLGCIIIAVFYTIGALREKQ